MMSDNGLSSIRGFIQDPNPSSNNHPNPNSNPASNKRKRNLPGNPDPDAEVIALSPKSLMATNRFICEICNKGFQRDQNLQLHRRGHNLPWKLKQRNKDEVIKKKVYICPEKSCVHHDPSRALGDLTGIKKHYSRKHGEKKWKCEKCSKKYAVQSDWKAHSKICGTREYKCDCGTLFSRKDSFITHRAFCDALAEESARFTSVPTAAANLNNLRNQLLNGGISHNLQQQQHMSGNSQFGSLFRPELMGLGSLDPSSHHQINLDGQKPRLPLWLHHDNANSGNPNDFLSAPSSTTSSLPHELVQMAPHTHMLGLSSSQNNNNNNNNIQWFINGNGGGASSSSMPRVLKEEEENKTISPMYYNNSQQQEITTPPAAHMSATALLQKAAQLGSTRSSSSNSPLFSSQFGLMASSSLSNLNNLMMNNSSSGASNVATIDNIQGNGLLIGATNATSLVGNNSNTLMMMQSKGKQVNIPSGNIEGNLTRDFLGVGGNEKRSFLQQSHELAKFGNNSGIF
ncbi:zinc finger protein BALDIBIS-like [Lycium ferocissimum]|uniref:zinc finger protein BALDIBIS-like n=1 Tax=Lycium ferocissimum TaxID=112874 RepID=UPI00281693B1|nr:zinc finger protein BALDIBIS-like [Lycium ferocissimum]